jgi:hypothetical protein
MEEKMQMIIQRIKEAQDWHKSYANVHRIDHNYEVGDRLFLRVKSHKSMIKFGKATKLSPRFVGPFEVAERKRPMAYQLALSDSLRHMNDFFHVSILIHYVSDRTHVIDIISLQVSNEGALKVEPI